MAEAQLPIYSQGLGFEQVWAALMETDRIVKENVELQKETDRIVKENIELQKETDRIVKENAEHQKETDRQMKETDRQMKETDRQIKEFNKRFGDFTNRFGEVVEYMIAPNLREKFREFGLIFPSTTSNSDIRDYENNIFFEIDIKLENGDKAMLVEVKTKLTTENVTDHVKRLEKMRVVQA